MEYAFIIVIFLIIAYIHFDYGCSVGRLDRIIIIISLVVFSIIFTEHVYYLMFIEDRSEKARYKKMCNDGNNSMRLFINIMKHPCFYI